MAERSPEAHHDRVTDRKTGEMSDEFDIRQLPPKYQFVFVMMKYFGFPLIVACALGWWIYHQEQNARADRESDRAAFVGALDSNTKELRVLVTEIRRLEDGHR